MTQRNPIAPCQGANQRVAALHTLAQQDYASASGNAARASFGTRYPNNVVTSEMGEPSDLEVAISVAQQLLDSDSVLSLRESLRLLLRALGAETEGR